MLDKSIGLLSNREYDFIPPHFQVISWLMILLTASAILALVAWFGTHKGGCYTEVMTSNGPLHELLGPPAENNLGFSKFSESFEKFTYTKLQIY